MLWVLQRRTTTGNSQGWPKWKTIISFSCPNYTEISIHSLCIQYIKYPPLYKSLHDIKCTWLSLGCSGYSNDDSINSSSQGVPYMTKNNCFLMSFHIWNKCILFNTPNFYLNNGKWKKNVPGCSRDALGTPTTNDNRKQPRMTYKKNNYCIFMS